MNQYRKHFFRPGVLAGILTLIIVWILLYIPTFWNRWFSSLYKDHVQAHYYTKAQTIQPFATGFSSIESHIHFQNLMMKAGENKTLEKSYRVLAQKNPDNANAWALYARVVTNASERNELLSKADTMSEYSPAVLAVQIENLLKKGRAGEAIKLCEDLPEGSWLKPYLEATTAWEGGLRERALQAFQRSLEHHAPLWIDLECARFLSETIGENPPDMNPFSGWPEEEIRKNPLAAAYQVTLFEESVTGALDFLPSEIFYLPESLAILARGAIQKEEYKTASWLLKRSQSIEENHIPTLVTSGILALKEGDRRRAQAYFSTGLNRQKDRYDEEFHYRFGLLLLKEGESETAISHLAQALGNPTNNLQIIKIKARHQLKSGQYSEAVKTFEEGLSIQPRDKELLRGMGEAALASENMEKAIDAYARLLNLDFEDTQARDQLTTLIAKQGNFNHAIGLYSAYLQKYPNSGHSYVRVAEIYNLQGNKKRAINFLQGILEDKPDIENREEIVQKIEELQNKQ